MIEGIISRKTRLETLNPGTLPVVAGCNPPILPKQGFCLKTFVLGAVSYTHLTLPTIYSV